MSKKVNKKLPELRFKEFKEKLLNTIFKKVVLSNQYGPRFNANDYDIDGNIKTIRGTDISLGGEIKYSQVPIAKLDFDFIKNHILKDGDLVMITTADCGLTGVFRKQDLDYIPSAYAVKITLNEMGDSEYFKYFFQTTCAKNEVRSFIRKATVANLPCSDILRIKLQLPNIQEQTKIADFLTTIDTRLTQLRCKRELLQTYKRGVMQKIFSQEVRFKGDDRSDFPEWENKKLGDICSYLNGKSYEENVVETGCYYLITLNSIDIDGNLKLGHKKIDFTDNSLKKGDLVMVLSDVAHGNFLGRINIIPSNNYVLNQRMGALRPKIKVNIYFLMRYINHNQHYFKLYGQGSSQKNLSKGDVLNFIVNFPTLKEQEKIADFLTAIDRKIEAVSRSIGLVEQFKKGLLQKMFV